jgi:hypothetical protein
MVRSGWVLDASLYSGCKYLAAETEARQSGRGLRAGEFDSPRRWRLDHSQRRAAEAATGPACAKASAGKAAARRVRGPQGEDGA